MHMAACRTFWQCSVMFSLGSDWTKKLSKWFWKLFWGYVLLMKNCGISTFHWWRDDGELMPHEIQNNFRAIHWNAVIRKRMTSLPLKSIRQAQTGPVRLHRIRHKIEILKNIILFLRNQKDDEFLNSHGNSEHISRWPQSLFGFQSCAILFRDIPFQEPWRLHQAGVLVGWGSQFRPICSECSAFIEC